MVAHAWNLSTWGWRQEDHEFKVILGYYSKLKLTLVSKQQEGRGTLRTAHHQQRLGITSGVKFVNEK